MTTQPTELDPRNMEKLFNAVSQAEIRYHTAKAEYDHAQCSVNSHQILAEHTAELVLGIRAQPGDHYALQWQSDYVVAQASCDRATADYEGAKMKLDEACSLLNQAWRCVDEAKRRFEEYHADERGMEPQDGGGVGIRLPPLDQREAKPPCRDTSSPPPQQLKAQDQHEA